MIERGNKPFKDALQDWMTDTGSTCWHRGAYIVNRKLNRRAGEARGMTTPYETYYGLGSQNSVKITLGDNAKFIKTEFGLQVIEEVLQYMMKYHPLKLLSDDKVKDIIQRGDALYEEENGILDREDAVTFDIEEKRQELVSAVLSEITEDHNDIDSVASTPNTGTSGNDR
jgi:hypothetical protein